MDFSRPHPQIDVANADDVAEAAAHRVHGQPIRTDHGRSCRRRSAVSTSASLLEHGKYPLHHRTQFALVGRGPLQQRRGDPGQYRRGCRSGSQPIDTVSLEGSDDHLLGGFGVPPDGGPQGRCLCGDPDPQSDLGAGRLGHRMPCSSDALDHTPQNVPLPRLLRHRSRDQRVVRIGQQTIFLAREVPEEGHLAHADPGGYLGNCRFVVALTGEELKSSGQQLLPGALPLTHIRMLVANILKSMGGLSPYCPAEVE